MGTGLPADAVTVNFDPGPADAPARLNCAGLWPFTATEGRNLLAYDRKLFLGTGMWMDQVIPNIGPAILSLKDGLSQFEIEHQFPATDTAVCLLHLAQFSRPAAYTVPIASVWRGRGFNDLYYRDFTNGCWDFALRISANPPPQSGTPQIRSAFNYTDPLTGVSKLFLGESPNGIYSLEHAPDARGGLGQPRLELSTRDLPLDPANPTLKQWRVMSFAVLNGKLYATIFNRLYERQNGPYPMWTLVHVDASVGASESGFRGLTPVASETPNPYFFVARESWSPAILKLTPGDGGWTQTVAYDTRAELSTAWTALYGGKVQATYGIAAYNGMTWFRPRGTAGPWALWIGIESQVTTRPASMPVIQQNGVYQMALGCYLVWNFEGRGEWRLCHLPPVTSQPMVSCRAGCVNPWGGTRFYIACYDCNYEPSHNSGCVVSVEMTRMIEGAIT